MKTKRNYIIVGLILLTFFVISFLTNILGVLNPNVSKSFALSDTMAGFLPFSFFIAYGVMSIPAGFLVERYGEKRLMIAAFALAFSGSLLFAGISNFPIFLFSLFAIGAGMAILQVVINPLLRVSGGEESYAFTSVLAQLIFGLASFISPQVYSYLVTRLDGPDTGNNFVINALGNLVAGDMSWVSIYWVFAAITALMVVVILFTKFNNIQLNDDEKVGSVESYLKLFKNKYVILYFFGIFAYVGSEQGISYWLSKFLQQYHGYDSQTLGADAVANFWGLMTIGGILGLVLLKFMDSKLALKIFTILSMLCFAVALFGSPVMSYYSFQLSGFFLSIMYPVIISLALNSVKSHHGSFAGILMTGIMGGAVVQLVIGLISDYTSLRIGMLFVFVCLGYILSLAFWAKPIISNKTIKIKDLFSKKIEGNVNV